MKEGAFEQFPFPIYSQGGNVRHRLEASMGDGLQIGVATIACGAVGPSVDCAGLRRRGLQWTACNGRMGCAVDVHLAARNGGGGLLTTAQPNAAKPMINRSEQWAV